MSDARDKDLLLHDPLSEETRKERRMLLAVSMVGIAIVKTGLVPSKISALGIEVVESDQENLLSLLSLIVIYFLTAFVIYATSDFLAWRKRIFRQTYQIREEGREIHHGFFERKKIQYYYLSVPVSITRALFEFALPILVGFYAAYVLWFSEVSRLAGGAMN